MGASSYRSSATRNRSAGRTRLAAAGDRPLVIAMTITLVTALLFTSMYGVGVAIGVIVQPIIPCQGMPPRVAALAFTMGIGAGTMVNLVQFGTWVMKSRRLIRSPHSLAAP